VGQQTMARASAVRSRPGDGDPAATVRRDVNAAIVVERDWGKRLAIQTSRQACAFGVALYASGGGMCSMARVTAPRWRNASTGACLRGSQPFLEKHLLHDLEALLAYRNEGGRVGEVVDRVGIVDPFGLTVAFEFPLHSGQVFVKFPP
jgi:hypothetical protein